MSSEITGSAVLKPQKKKKAKRENSATSFKSKKSKVAAPVEVEDWEFVRPHEDEDLQNQLESSIDKKR